MSKEHAMTVLGLGRGTKRRNLTDYNEKELYDAFTEESKHLLGESFAVKSSQNLESQKRIDPRFWVGFQN